MLFVKFVSIRLQCSITNEKLQKGLELGVSLSIILLFGILIHLEMAKPVVFGNSANILVYS